MVSVSSSRLGTYQLLYTLGAGGMGEVFLARQVGEHGIHRLVAVKRILSHLARDKNLVALFLDEVRIAAQLNHGNIVQVIDHGCIDGQYFMALEYVHGENLFDLLARLSERQQRLPLDLALHIVSCVCEGLDYAHRKEGFDGKPLNIVHRDISPHNVMLSFQGQVKIADFGVARASAQTHQTIGGELRGKLSYMSPEQAYGRELDHRSDLFSLGVVLYEALSGHNPYRRDNPLATLEAVRGAQIASLALVRQDLPPEVTELVHQTLRLAADERPDSARTMHEEIQRIVRLHQLAVSPFDLADYLADLFPESAARDSDPSVEATAVGRRADHDVATLERMTLHYLRTRRPGGETALLAGVTTEPPLGPRRSPARALALLAALLLVGGTALLWWGDHANERDELLAIPDATPREKALAVVPATLPASMPRPANAAAAAAAPAELATLVLSSRPPGATAMIDGARQATRTPLSLALAPGRRRLKLALRGYAVATRTIELVAGATLRLEVPLTPLKAHVAVRSTHPCQVRLDGRPVGQTPLLRTVRPGPIRVECVERNQGIRVTRRLRARPGETARLELRFGVLAVNVEPWAAVTVDGKKRGSTPLRLLLPSGEHEVILENSAADRRKRALLEVRAGATTRISHW